MVLFRAFTLSYGFLSGVFDPDHWWRTFRDTRFEHCGATVDTPGWGLFQVMYPLLVVASGHSWIHLIVNDKGQLSIDRLGSVRGSLQAGLETFPRND